MVHTNTGFLVTVGLFTLVIYYGLIKFVHLTNNHNPNVTSTVRYNYHNSSEDFILSE
jgi:hypothetical protein